ncbi:MAG: toxic anion resistance protein, partial [Clostridiaceae bacterium]|nr:toxic anion resistance protein [Clostridiaceae bacterium]
RYDKISVQIEKIIDQLDRAKLQLIRDITTLDTMYQKNLEYLHQLDMFIMAGSLKLKELNDKVLPQLKEKATRTGDAMDAQKVKDMAELISRFEKKIHDLKLSRMIAIQSAPQIRLIQNNDQTLVEKIQSSIMNTIPLWKNQIAIAITMLRQQSALKLQRDVTNTTNELLSRNSEMLKTSSIEIARENERGIVDIETLKKVNQDLIETLEETLTIQQEGRQRRLQAETELRTMEDELKRKLLEMKDRV